MSRPDATQPTPQRDAAASSSVAATHGVLGTKVIQFFRAGGVWMTSAVLFAVCVIIAALTGDWLVR